ncbi:tRNA (adenosine(37)-N6)-threonylcarbamoyltransferase complex ATPase subunit type 1 TsaE [soil metagenome]
MYVEGEEGTRAAGGAIARSLRPGDVVFLNGELGAGKTTFVRGVLEALGWKGAVRSPTFTLIQTYATEPPVLHADLYRVAGWQGLGLEDYFEDHILLIEWPDRAMGLVSEEEAWRIQIDFKEGGREITISRPNRP